MNRASQALPSAETIESVVRFAALDGYTLGATLYSRRGLAVPSSVVLFSCGGAVPAVRYARFARHLAQRGVAVLVYDYRGIGASRPATLRGFSARAEDWSEFDCGGAIAYLRCRFPESQLIGMAHSIGSLLTCGAPNVAEISRFVFLCPHTGYYGDYLPKYRLPMAVLWHGVMPLVTRIVGYFPARRLGLGQDIPAGVALQWSARTSPKLQSEATGVTAKRTLAMVARYEHVQGEALAFGFADDAFATPAGSRRFLEAFPGLHARSVSIAPRQVGMSKIGHFGLFRRSAEVALAPMVLRILQDWTPF
jgi:predicted alpha/beta hydrolase